MIRTIPLLAAVAVFALGACQKPAPCPACPPPPAPPPAVDAKAEEDAIRALIAKWNEAIVAKDAATITAFYADDATFMPPNEESRTGPAIGQAWDDFVKMPGVTLTIVPAKVEVDHDGAMAIDQGTFQFAFDGPAGRVEDHGKYVVVWEKKAGQWKVAADIYNSSVPVPAPAAEPAKKK